ncbi:MAG: type II toxin-antitoxin system VapC family toxin [Planctomycetes bacterium]|nr:type II toxin-antitoxin system VapC family toxin [Planctomycetota bacterium]
MKVVDVNILLYAVNEDAPLHARAKSWFEKLLSGTEAVGFEWSVLLAFLRLSTRTAVFPKPLRLDAAFAMIDSWLAQPCAVVVGPGERHLDVLRDFLTPLGAAGNLTSDAHLAAVARELGAEICSCDADYARFPGLRWTNPLR